MVQRSKVQRLDNNRNRLDVMLKTRGEHPKVRTLAPLDPEPLNLDKRIKIQARFQGNSRGSRIGSWVNASGTPEIQRNCQ
jgi:hypothetical protein